MVFKYILVFFFKVFLLLILTDCIDGRWGPDKQQRYKEGGCDKGGCHLQTHYLCMRSGFSLGGSWGGGMYVWNVQESSEALVVTVASDKDNNNFCRDVFSLLALSF